MEYKVNLFMDGLIGKFLKETIKLKCNTCSTEIPKFSKHLKIK